jgi:hypothetical protein
LLWQRPLAAVARATRNTFLTSPAVTNGVVYIGNYGDIDYYPPPHAYMYAIDAKSGVHLNYALDNADIVREAIYRQLL